MGDAEAKAGRVEAATYSKLGEVSLDRLPCMTFREAGLLAQLSYAAMGTLLAIGGTCDKGGRDRAGGRPWGQIAPGSFQTAS